MSSGSLTSKGETHRLGKQESVPQSAHRQETLKASVPQLLVYLILIFVRSLFLLLISGEGFAVPHPPSIRSMPQR